MELELDMLFLFFMLADQINNINIQRARAHISRHSILIYAQALIDHEALPNVSDILVSHVKNLGLKWPRCRRVAYGRGEGKDD